MASPQRRPLCFVLMPFGTKPDATGRRVEFDAVYRRLIAPAIADAGLEPLRADQELVGGIVHKPMFERLILADYAVADLTTANANVFYELGVRHAVRPYSTVLVGANLGRIPFDLALDRVLPYRLGPGGAPAPQHAEEDRTQLAAHLRAAREAKTDSPIFQLIGDLPTPQIDRLKTDVFREQVEYSVEAKRRLAEARDAGLEAVRGMERELGRIEDVEAGVVVDLLLSFRAVKAWEDMIALVERMPAPLAQTQMIQEQLGLALNRAGRREAAERVLKAAIESGGASSETYGLLGRVYKDRWAEERERSPALARGFLRRAIDAYRMGFESDWRDAYPGVNAVTLMEIQDPGGSEQQVLLPVVSYAVRRRVGAGEPDYWDHATRLELAVLGGDETAALDALTDALAAVREPWEPESTANNLRLVREAREARDSAPEWAREIEAELMRAAGAEQGVG